jgi:hypothetical protein
MSDNELISDGQGVLVELTVYEDSLTYSSPVQTAIVEAEGELETLKERISTVATLKTKCDKIDYALAASIGALSGVIDVFLVGKPGESSVGNKTDVWFDNRTKGFAKLNGWKGGDKKSALRFLEKKFSVPYDQRGMGDAASSVFDLAGDSLTPSNHHFKSLAHNPTLLGLFFSILNQFTNTSHFVSINDFGNLIELVDADNGAKELHGKTLPAKIICGTFNWLGHLISDVSGASKSRGRGSGIPSPLWTWINDVLTIKAKLQIPHSKFDEEFYNLAIKMFEQGYDFRFQTAQAVPVIFNELTVRLLYSLRRYFCFKKENKGRQTSFKDTWNACKPFDNPEVNRMLTVAHGTFCVVDITDATARGFATGGGVFNPVEFFLRLNVIGIGRFTISLGYEIKHYKNARKESKLAKREKAIVKDYLDGLRILADVYSDDDLSSLTKQISSISTAEEALHKTARVAEQRGTKALNSIDDVRNYFRPEQRPK